MVYVVYIKVRENKRVLSKACHIAIGINEKGNREIIGFDISDGESENSWANFFEYLKNRGLSGVKMLISDSHKGLVKAIKETSYQKHQRKTQKNLELISKHYLKSRILI